MMDSDRYAHEKSPDMGKPCDRAMGMHAEISLYALKDKPYEDEYDGRHFDDLKEKYQWYQGEDASFGVQDQICPHDGCDGARCPHDRDRRVWIDECMCVECHKDCTEIEEYEADNSQVLFQRRTEDGQEDAITDEVDVAYVDESRGEYGHMYLHEI